MVPSYSLDVMKSGVELGSRSLKDEKKSFYVFGRLGNCDVQLEHPSISRHHAVLQYGNFGISDQKSGCKLGWHLFDLGSTHGTWLNKQRIPPKQYIRLHVGHVLKLGGSTRLFILQGPQEDAERESSRTVTQLKEENNRKKLIAQGVLDDPQKDSEKSEESKETVSTENQGDSGITWGMGVEEDDGGKMEEEEGEGEGEEIDFESLQQREDYYRDDPKAVLRKWFERNEWDLNYAFSEKGIGFKHQWVCTVELPLDTPSGKPLEAEVIVSGSKREAQVQCALEACRLLDAHGVLRAQSESKKKKLKSLADNDYYDSDEDNFFDRTGELERKREARKRRSLEGSVEEQKAETYESLCSKLQKTRDLITESQKELDFLVSGEDSEKTKRRKSGDALDDYMSTLKDATPGTEDAQEIKMHKSRLRLKLVELKKEANHWERLAKIAKPISLPPLRKPGLLKKTDEAFTGGGAAADGEDGKEKKKGPMVWVGSMKGHRRRRVEVPARITNLDSPAPSGQDKESSQEVEEEEEEELHESSPPCPKLAESSGQASLESIPEAKDTADKPSEQRERVYSAELEPEGLARPSEASKKQTAADKTAEKFPAAEVATAGNENLQGSAGDDEMEEEPEIEKQPPVKKARRNPQKRKTEKIGELGDYDARDPDYAIWLPPDNQSGDGTTSLNAKYGY